MYATMRVVRGLDVTVASTGAQFGLFAVIFLATHRHENDHVVLVKFGKMAHENVTVSLVVDVAVTVTIVSLGAVVVSVVCVTPAENVAV